jgi:hypothetical protein
MPTTLPLPRFAPRHLQELISTLESAKAKAVEIAEKLEASKARMPVASLLWWD